MLIDLDHLPCYLWGALSTEGAGRPVTLDDFDAASRRVPVLANIRPSGDQYLMEDFFYAGGMPGLLSRIRGHLALDAMTVAGIDALAQVVSAALLGGVPAAGGVGLLLERLGL